MSEVQRATPYELAKWRGRLAAWSRPARFRLIVEHMRKTHGTYNLDQPGSSFKDAFVAARCAALAKADAVRLGADPPDFELRHGDQVRRFEVVEAAAPGRRRGAELKHERRLPPSERDKPVHIPGEEWTRADVALAQVRRALERKQNHRYAPGTLLVVYLNIWPVSGEAKLAAGLAAATASGLAQFPEVWVLNGQRLKIFTA